MYLKSKFEAPRGFYLMQNSVRTRLRLQLNCPSDGHWGYAGIFAVEVRFQVRDQFWIPQPKLHGAKYLIFFVKPQNMVV